MASCILWDFQFRLRSKNSSGAVLHTYKPVAGTVVSTEIVPEDVTLEREMVDRSRDDYPLGFYRHYLIGLEIVDGHFTAASTFDALETVLTDRYTSGNYFELTLNGEAGSPTWVKVRIEPGCDISPKKIDGTKNVGIRRDFEFSTCALVTADDALDGMD